MADARDDDRVVDRAAARPGVRWSASPGLAFGLAALIAAPLIGLDISSALGNREGRVTWLTLFVGVFLVGCFFWWLLMSRAQRVSIWRGAITGIFVAVFSYPVVVALAQTLQRDWPDGLHAQAIVRRLYEILWITGLTLMTTGFAATLLMAAVGIAAAWAITRLHPARTRDMPQRSPRKRIPFFSGIRGAAGAIAVVLVLALAGSFAWLTLTPIDAGGLALDDADSTPARTYEEAIAAYEAIRTEEAAMALHPRCLSTLLSHGRKVRRVVIYFHGLTSCPAQGAALADKLLGLGYNVYLPRMFGHGEADPLTLSLSDLTAEELVMMANSSVDMAQGLGDEVVVVGLSAGGTIAAWAAQNRSDVDVSLPTSPFFGPYIVPPWATHAATNLVLALPNTMFWFNPLEPVTAVSSDLVFPRPSTQTLAQVMRLGRIVFASAQDAPPAAGQTAMLLNDADVAVNNALALELVDLWRRHGRDTPTLALPFSQYLPHDLINPEEIFGDTPLVYSILIDMMSNERQ